MKRKIQFLMMALLLITAMPLTAQVLWSDNFDSYTIGHLSNDPTGQNPGQGGWFVRYDKSEIRVVSEPGRGNVLAWGWTTGYIDPQFNITVQSGLSALWNTRTLGNDVMKLEYELYAEDFSLLSGNYFQASLNYALGDTGSSVASCHVSATESYIQNNNTYTPNNYRTAYNHTWIKVEHYIDLDVNNNTVYMFCYIPSLNYLGIRVAAGSDIDPYSLRVLFRADQVLHSGALVKYDNFKLSALPTRPSYLSTSEFVTSKFNVFPNPVTDMVTITNSESIGIEQIEVFDISGKTVKSLSFNNENEVQLNLGDFASGMYLLHIKTNEGVAVKKVVKK